MGKTNSALGKSVANHLGYNVRMIVASKTDDKTKKTMKLHTGKFGIYAGKNKLQEADSIDSAIKLINGLFEKRK